MHKSKHIDSCIELIKSMLADTNNELTSGQRSELKQGIRNLKRLRKATNLTHQETFLVVSRIAEAVYEVVSTGMSA